MGRLISMLSLKNYIIKKTIIKRDYPSWTKDDLDDHFFIEFEMNCCSDIILEQYGKYDGQIELAQQLTNKIRNDYRYITNEISRTYTIDADEINKEASDEEKFPGFFYHKLTIVVDPKSSSTAYIPSENNFDNKENKFNNVKIYIGNNSLFNGKNRLFKSILHELTHAWHDYNSYIKDEFGHNKGKSLQILGKESKYYHNIRNDKPITNIEKFCKSIMYLLTKFESNAYSSEIYSELEEYDGKIIYWKDAWKVFRNSSTYKSFIDMYISLNNLQKLSNVEQKTIFAEYYNKHNKTNLTFNKIYKKLNNQFEKLFEHIMKNCSKIYYEWTEKQQIKENIQNGINEYIPLDELW